MRGKKEIYKCKNCKNMFSARIADRKRGWALFCSKSCKAKKQEKRTKQMTQYLLNKKYYSTKNILDVEDDTHPFSSDALGQW